MSNMIRNKFYMYNYSHTHTHTTSIESFTENAKTILCAVWIFMLVHSFHAYYPLHRLFYHACNLSNSITPPPPSSSSSTLSSLLWAKLHRERAIAAIGRDCKIQEKCIRTHKYTEPWHCELRMLPAQNEVHKTKRRREHQWNEEEEEEEKEPKERRAWDFGEQVKEKEHKKSAITTTQFCFCFLSRLFFFYYYYSRRCCLCWCC